MFTANLRQNHELLYKVRVRHDRRGGLVHTAVVMLFVFIVGSVTLLVGIWEFTRNRFYLSHIVIYTDHVIHQTNEKFLSFALDTSAIRNGWVHENIKSEKLLKLTSLLAPAHFRVGGTMADRLIFVADSSFKPSNNSFILDGGECSNEIKKCDAQNISFFNMSGEDWVSLNSFTKSTNLTLLFDLNVLLRHGSQWDETNVKELLDFSNSHKFDVNWQLGNEPNSFYHVFGVSVSATYLGHYFKRLRHILDSYSLYKNSLLVGPDVTNPKIKKLNRESVPYLKEFLKQADTIINAISWHQYYMNGRKAKLKDFINPHVLNELACEISMIRNATAGTLLPIWLSETGSAYGGGAPNMSNRFVAIFLLLDKLGMAARLGLDVVIRQAIFGGYYGLLDDLFEPLPDWWLSVLYKKLVGPGVLHVTGTNILDNPCEGAQGHLRIYCHCTKGRSNSVTIFALNLVNLESRINVKGLSETATVLAYVLTADEILKSRHILLNNKRLVLEPDGSLPTFEPVAFELSKQLILPPFSAAFWTVQDVSVPACT